VTSLGQTDEQQNEQKNRQTDEQRHRVKPPLFGGGLVSIGNRHLSW